MVAIHIILILHTVSSGANQSLKLLHLLSTKDQSKFSSRNHHNPKSNDENDTYVFIIVDGAFDGEPHVVQERKNSHVHVPMPFITGIKTVCLHYLQIIIAEPQLIINKCVLRCM